MIADVIPLAATGQLLDARAVQVVVEPRLVSTEVAARMYGVSQRTIELLIESRGFPSVRIGRRLLVPVARADAWVAALTDGGAA